MTTSTSLQKAETFEIEKYKAPKDVRSLSRTHAPFSGAPHKHPQDPNQVIVVPDPYNPSSPYLEFCKQDIAYVEKLANIVNLDGETVMMARIWVKQGSVAVQCTPFQVTPREHKRV